MRPKVCWGVKIKIPFSIAEAALQGRHQVRQTLPGFSFHEDFIFSLSFLYLALIFACRAGSGSGCAEINGSSLGSYSFLF